MMKSDSEIIISSCLSQLLTNSVCTTLIEKHWNESFFLHFSRMTMAWSHRRRLHWLKPKWWSKITSSTLFYIFVKNMFSRFLISSLGNIHHIHFITIFYYVDTFVIVVAYDLAHIWNVWNWYFVNNFHFCVAIEKQPQFQTHTYTSKSMRPGIGNWPGFLVIFQFKKSDFTSLKCSHGRSNICWPLIKKMLKNKGSLISKSNKFIFLLSVIFGLNFINILHTAFTHIGPECAK